MTPITELRGRPGLEDIAEVLQYNRLWWDGQGSMVMCYRRTTMNGLKSAMIIRLMLLILQVDQKKKLKEGTGGRLRNL